MSVILSPRIMLCSDGNGGVAVCSLPRLGPKDVGSHFHPLPDPHSEDSGLLAVFQEAV